VAQWTLDWIASRTDEYVKKAFKVCGLLAKEAFEMDSLHAPLKAVLNPDFNLQAWHAAYQHLVSEGAERELVNVAAPDWHIPDNERSSLFCCLVLDLNMPVHEYVAAVTNYMANIEDLVGLLDEAYLESVRLGDTVPGELEIFAASKMHG
jgi:hypothetical protein